MIIIGDKINSSIRSIAQAIESNNSEFISELAKKQYESGASYININLETLCDSEPEKMSWVINSIQQSVEIPFSICSQNPETIASALKANRNSKPIINSITSESKRYNCILPLVLEYNTGVIALCMDDNGMPETVEDRLTIADRLIGNLTKAGISPEDIYIDPVARPVGTSSNYGIVVLETIRRIRDEFPGIHITCELYNISFGIPVRELVNEAFLISVMTCGMDSVILDPLDRKLMSFLYAGEALLGKDEFCMNYQMKFREGLLEF